MLDYYEDGFVVCEEGLIVEVLSADDYFAKMPGGVSYEDLRPYLLVPGFIDNHVHMPQQDIIAGRSSELLDWLDRHAFPAELRYADPVSYTHLRSPRDISGSRMPSSA